MPAFLSGMLRISCHVPFVGATRENFVVAGNLTLLARLLVQDGSCAITNPDVGVLNRAKLGAANLADASLFVVLALAILFVVTFLGLDVENLTQFCEVFDNSCHRKILLKIVIIKPAQWRAIKWYQCKESNPRPPQMFLL